MELPSRIAKSAIDGIGGSAEPKPSLKLLSMNFKLLLVHHVTRENEYNMEYWPVKLLFPAVLSGRRAALLPPAPLRTVHASFPAHGSSLSKAFV
jgi:hypothetical protein